MLNPSDPRSAMIAALQRSPQGQQMAGDVVPLPIAPSPTAGMTNMSAPYATGMKQNPNIAPIPMNVLEEWMKRTTNRPR